MSGGLHHLCPSVWGRHTLLSHPVMCVKSSESRHECVLVCVCVCECLRMCVCAFVKEYMCEKEKKKNSRPPQIALV